MIAAAGYSGTPLARKLGLKDGQAVAFAGLPAEHEDFAICRAFASVELATTWDGIGGEGPDYIHLFTADRADVEAATPVFRGRIRPDGMIWMSWPKKASRVPTDLTGDVIRERALADVLVDVKVCAIDAVWSALKLVIRKEHRA